MYSNRTTGPAKADQYAMANWFVMKNINRCEFFVLCRAKAGQISYPRNTECRFCSDCGGFVVLMGLVD